MLLPLAIVSTFLFLLSFAFSFIEFAFSRYFGAYALAFNIPVTAYLIYMVVVARKTSSPLKTSILRFALIGIMGLGVVSSVTDPTMLPKIGNESTLYRNTDIYPSELELIAWDDFYSYVGDEHRLIRTNLNGGPVQSWSTEESARVDVSAFFQQKLCHLNVAVAGGNMERFRDELQVAFRRRRFAPLAIP